MGAYPVKGLADSAGRSTRPGRGLTVRRAGQPSQPRFLPEEAPIRTAPAGHDQNEVTTRTVTPGGTLPPAAPTRLPYWRSRTSPGSRAVRVQAALAPPVSRARYASAA
jgi:hypothetical protein